MKTYSHMAFNITVPLDWQDDTGPEDRTITLASENGQDRLIVSIMRFVGGITKEQAVSTFQHYLEDCRNDEVKRCDGLKLTDAETTDQGNYMFTRYGGYDPEINRRFVTLITAENGKLLNFQFESMNTSDEYTNELASRIFETIEVN